MHWTYQGKQIDELPDGCEAFVYLITNLTNGMMYVGKKLAKFKVTRPPLKGKKNKRRSTKESDWKDYWGSSDRLNADVERLGAENFTREILHICPSRGIASYLEAREQFERRVLETDDYYIFILYKCNTCITVWIIFNCLHCPRHFVFVTTEINLTV